ncbi:MAG: ABC transporter ATP-binding protein [Proteobacteria bacterium]|nr:ABC transporter ATP-binding protein [Pseudomonadota bacterium]
MTEDSAQTARAAEKPTPVGASFAGTVTLEDVGFEGQGRTILHNISAEFEAGKIACLLGPSGCGKTSLLRLIAGISKQHRGRILIDGLEMAGPARFVPPEKRNVGLVFQDFALFPHMTALENVAYGLYALSRSDAMAAARRGLQRVGLEALAHRYPGSLSGGEQQRVALARAIAPRPQVILLDEPFSGLDQRMRDQVRAETLAIVRETRATAILVTHDPREAVDVGDRIFLMRDGRMVQHGTPRDIYEHPVDADAAQFFGTYNVFRVAVKNGAAPTPLGTFAAKDVKDGDIVDILVKPEAVLPAEGGLGVAGFVKDIRFLGETQRLTLLVKGQEAPVHSIVSVRHKVETNGEVRLSVDPSGVFVFTSPGASPT